MPDDCLSVRAKYKAFNEIEPRHILFFENGACVFWNVSPEEQHSVFDILHQYSDRPFADPSVYEEFEVLSFSQIKVNVNENACDKESVEENSEAKENLSWQATPNNKEPEIGQKKQPVYNVTRLVKNHIYFKDYTTLKPTEREERHMLEKVRT